MMGRIDIVFISDGRKNPAILRGKGSRGDPPDQPLLAHPVLDEIGYRHTLDAVFLREDFKIGHTGHGSVIVHDLTDDPCRLQSRQSCKVDRSFGLACTHENSPPPRSQGKDMTRGYK